MTIQLDVRTCSDTQLKLTAKALIEEMHARGIGVADLKIKQNKPRPGDTFKSVEKL